MLLLKTKLTLQTTKPVLKDVVVTLDKGSNNFYLKKLYVYLVAVPLTSKDKEKYCIIEENQKMYEEFGLTISEKLYPVEVHCGFENMQYKTFKGEVRSIFIFWYFILYNMKTLST